MPHDPDDPRDPHTRESIFDARDRPLSDEPIGPPDQPFRLVRRLGIGGMGEVCLARDLEEERLLGHPPRYKALKLLGHGGAAPEEIQRQFHREALRAARLAHPNVVNVFGFRVDARRGLAFIVMEYLQGTDLAEMLRKDGQRGFPVSRVMPWLRQIAAGVEHAHGHGLIHRDLKPANIMLVKGNSPRGETLKVLDFGVAYQLRLTGLTTVEYQPAQGTQQYMPPEMHDEEPGAHPNQDVYALSCIGYEFLTGGRPFSVEAAKLGPERRNPRRRGLSRPLYQALCRGFAHDAEKRPQTVSDWLQSVEAAVAAPRRRRRQLAALLLAGALLGGGTWLWGRVDWRMDAAFVAPLPESEAVAQLRQSLAAAEEREATLRQALESARQRRDAAQRDLAAAREAGVASAREVERLGAALATATQRVDGLSGELREAEDAREAALAEAGRLQEALTGARARVTALENRLAELEKAPRSPPHIDDWSAERVAKLQRDTAVALGTEPEFRDTLADGAPGPLLRVIPAGSFTMGSPEGENGRISHERQHRVTIDQPFALARYELTVGEFGRFVADTSYKTDAEKGDGCTGWTGSSWSTESRFNWRNPGFEQADDHPVACISWNDATAYAGWLSEQTGEHYFLPSEAQWEYATRAGSTTAYWWGNEIGSNRANCHGDGCGDSWQFTAPVGSFPANAFGLHDTAGNVWEWTCSGYDGDYQGAEQRCISNNDANTPRPFRGESWAGTPLGVRSATRVAYAPAHRHGYVGVRLARSLTL